MPLYRVKNWDTVYENNRSREIESLNFVLIPNRHDTDSYATLIGQGNGAALFGTWISILMVASKGRRRRQGLLIRDTGSPHDAASLARVIRIPEGLVQEALDESVACGLLEIVPQEPATTTPQEPATTTPQEPALELEQNILEGKELKACKVKVPSSVERELGKAERQAAKWKISGELMTEIRSLLTANEMTNDGGKWNKRSQSNAAKLQRVLADVAERIKSGAEIKSMPRYLEDTWKRFA